MRDRAVCETACTANLYPAGIATNGAHSLKLVSEPDDLQNKSEI
jgi:hypothetical protein